MFVFFKYFIYLLLVLSVILFYLLFTPMGNSTVYGLISTQLSEKTDVQIEVKDIILSEYPQVHIEVNIQRKAKLILDGYLDDTRMNMDYTLTSDCIATEECKIDDIINIHGNVQGLFSRLMLKGQGTALDGKIKYQAIKYPNKVEDITLDMYDINSTKLLRLLGQTALIKGKANASVHFDIMSNTHKRGVITYDVKDKDFQGIPLSLHTKVKIQDDTHTFIMDATSPHLLLHITKGIYQQEAKTAKAHYVLDIQDLSKLESLLGNKYRGSFYAMGEISYGKDFTVTGLSKSFGGMTDFVFEKEGLSVTLKDAQLHQILHLFPFPTILTAHATGKLYYNFVQETLVVNTTLKNAKFLHCKLVDVIYKKAGVNLLHETFDNSSLNLTYHNSIILGDLHLANERSHIYLNNTTINTQKSTINAYFDFKMQKQEFAGKVYGPLDKPKVNLNMQKLVRYQMDKQVDKLIGKNTRKIIESMPLGNVAKDLATDVGASFMKVFFLGQHSISFNPI
ncbi:MAG: hypothetical protein Q9M36_10355 [Sulfurovum sp.]|nr:hypothetical protein [Sulfurovum sp.]